MGIAEEIRHFGPGSTWGLAQRPNFTGNFFLKADAGKVRDKVSGNGDLTAYFAMTISIESLGAADSAGSGSEGRS